jgi:spermidine synthase
MGPLVLSATVMLCSGFAALAYQILWLQQSSLWLGQESAAVIAIVAAFFGGLALGSLALARRIEASNHPARIYAICEIALAAWGLALIGLLQDFAGLLATLVGPDATPLRQWSVAFGGTFLILLPGTAAMGATLPALERSLRGLGGLGGQPGGSGHASAFGVLYAANTAGALLGVLVTAFWLLPTWGLARTAALCALVNLGCAAAALCLPVAAHPGVAPASRGNAGPQLALLFATGLLGIAFELAIVRSLSQVAQNTVYTFALLLSVYLAGTALGAAAHARYISGRRVSASLRTTLLCTLSLATLAGTVPLAWAVQLHAGIAALLPAGVAGALAAEGAMALIVFLPASVAMGITFTQLVAEARRAGASTGAALAANTSGGALAAPLFSVALLPGLGLRLVLLAIAGAYFLFAAPGRWRSRTVLASAAALALVATLLPALDLTTLPAGARLLQRWEGRMASVSVVEDRTGTRTLHIDNRQQEGSSSSTYADARQALLPLLLHPDPRRALFLGVGTGVTASAATLDPEVHVDAVEIVPEVLDAAAWFTSAYPEGADRRRLRTIAADARRFVRAAPSGYDLIVADNFHPARSGTGALYSQEHFEFVRQRLNAGGLFCQWLPLHQLDTNSLRSVVRSFIAVYPDAVALLATNSLDTPTLGLLAWNGAGPTPESVRRRLASLPHAARATFDLADEFAVLGAVVAGPGSLRAYSHGVPANTDDRPFVAYRAPFEAYAPQSLPRERLVGLVRDLHVDAGDVWPDGARADAWNARLESYWAARRLYLEAGSRVRPVASLTGMLQQVREPLLDVLRVSPDFAPAYDPLLRMAAALLPQDPAAGRRLLAALEQAQPRRREAAELLQRFDGARTP